MNGYAKSFNETEWMCFLMKDDEPIENIRKSGIKSVKILKKDLIVNQYSMKNIYKLKLSLTKENQYKFSWW